MSLLAVVVPDLPAVDMPEIFAAVPVEFKLTPGVAYMRLLSTTSVMASVKRKAVESLRTRLVSGSFSKRTFPLWSKIFVKKTGFVYMPPLAMVA